MRDRVSDAEKLGISATYYFEVTGDLEKAAQASDFWVNSYPRNPIARIQLGVTCMELGRYDQAISSFLDAIRLDPTSPIPYTVLASSYVLAGVWMKHWLQCNNFKLAISIFRRHSPCCTAIDFLQNDAAGMAQQAAQAMGKPGS